MLYIVLILGKYSHAACFNVKVAYKSEGVANRAVTCMITNFTPPNDTEPSLLSYSEVVTFFHEFGHVMHSICSNSAYHRLNWTWTAVEHDFLEVPSKMFENWLQEPHILKQISGHFETGEPIPDELVKNLIDADNVNYASGTKSM